MEYKKQQHFIYRLHVSGTTIRMCTACVAACSTIFIFSAHFVVFFVVVLVMAVVWLMFFVCVSVLLPATNGIVIYVHRIYSSS